MKISQAALLGLCSSGALAFRDTSPFFAFSTSDHLGATGAFEGRPQAALSSQLDQSLDTLSSKCDTDVYIFVHQPGVSANDFHTTDGTPNLRRRMVGKEGSVKSSYMVPDVSGDLNLRPLKAKLIKTCNVDHVKLDIEAGAIGADAGSSQLIEVDFAELPTHPRDRAAKLEEHDSFLNAVIGNLGDKSHTVIYTTSPPAHSPHSNHPDHESQAFEYEEKPFTQAVHVDLKRDVGDYEHVLRPRQNSSRDGASGRGIFETYTLLDDAIFQGGIAAIIMISILYVGISALSGIEISYASFSKEMGPAAQKKQQQQQQQPAQ